MPVDAKLFESLNRLIRKYPSNSKVDWFVMGYLYAHPNNIKTLEDVFNTVNNITQLARDDSLSIEESNDVLLRMMNNLSNSDRSKTRNSQNSQREEEESNSRSNEWEKTKKSEEGNKKKLMFPIKMNGGNKRALIEDDMSYKSESDTELRKDSPKKNSRTGRFEDMIREEDSSDEEDTFKRRFAFGNSNKSTSQATTYVKKPVTEVDTSSLRDNRNLKRSPEVDEEQLSMELIKRLQEEDSRSQRLLEEKSKREEKEAKEAKETMDGICSICLGSLLDESFIPLEGCEHIFHENCFAEYLKSEIQSRHFPIKCPSNCGQEVSQSDMVQVLDKDIVAKFYEYSLQKYVTLHGDDMSCCPTPGCTYVFYQDEGEKTNELNCPLCKKKYCLDCKVEYHKGLSCKEYQMMKKMESNSNKFEKFSQGKKYKQCPKCKLWVEKMEGYDHLTCRCKHQFCYKCGGKYRNCECVKKMQEEIQRKQELARQKQQEMKNRKKRH